MDVSFVIAGHTQKFNFGNFEFSVLSIKKIINGRYHKNQVICPHIVYAFSMQLAINTNNFMQIFTCRLYEFSVVAILKIQNGGRYSC